LEFSPMFYQTGIVFVSTRANGEVDPKTNQPFFELFYADTDRNGIPLKPEPFSLEINSNVHEGPVAFSKNGNNIFFTRNNTKNGVTKADAQNRIGMKVYSGVRGQYDWENITELSFNNDEYTVFHPTLSPDGTKLYFSSNMPGGFGGFDLYVSEKKGESWGKPMNLGANINTSKKEAFPFIHESGSLFFTSDGHKDNVGGLDMYMAKVGADGEFLKAENLGDQFNSDKDDLGLILNTDGTRGYFTSDRTGGFGKDDIYFFEIKEGLNGTSVPLDGLVISYDETTKEPLADVSVKLLEGSPDGLTSNGDLYDVMLMPSGAGANELSLKLVKKNNSALDKPDKITDKDGMAPLSLKSNKQYILLVAKKGYENEELVLSTIGKKEGSITTEVFMKRKTCADITGVIKMSKNNIVVPNALVKVTNNCTKEVITTRTNSDGVYTVCLRDGCDYSIVAEKEGYEPSKAGKTPRIVKDFTQTYTVNLDLNPINGKGGSIVPTGTVIVLENIYYDFGKWNIRAGAARELDALSALMKRFPSMEIELSSHTDCRGSDDYNKDLSVKRAEAAHRYLVARGVDSRRIKPLGMGESIIRNKCKDGVDCSEEEHQYNRRTEIKIIRIDEPVSIKYEDKGPEVIDRKKE
jgi:outer membrane protein OmpA-like peptidoglycan-associated protein